MRECGLESMGINMRTEKEMLALIKRVAEEDERIRAAYLEGSRANPNVPRDIFQDYDIEYIVTETKSFREDKKWIDRFGERLYMQYPEESVYYPADVDNCYGWLLQLADGNRLDLHVCTEKYALAQLELYRTLVDKDNIMPKEQETSDERYWIKRPTKEEFACSCNEFWWCLNNVAKGLWRNELPYVMDMLDFAVRPMLKRLLEWKIGMEHHFSVSAGKAAKYMNRYLSEEAYKQFLATYAYAGTKELWKAVFQMCDLFQATAIEISGVLNLDYDREEAKNSRDFLEHVKKLPANAKEIY